jgi:hypothetical protein
VKTFFLLQRAFQKKLRDYAMVLEKKLPPPVGRGVAKLALIGAGVGGSSSTQAGEEVTVCNAIDTCEYYADMVEALEDLILDKIGDKYSFGRIRQTTSTQFLSSLKTLKLDEYSRLWTKPSPPIA